MMQKHLFKFFRIFRAVFSISTSSMLAYRSNVFFFFIFETGFMVATFLSAGLGVEFAGGSIAGWSTDEIYLLTAINAVSHHLFLCFGIGAAFGIPYDIAEGKMDFVLLKPLHPLSSLYASHEFIISNLPNLLISGSTLVYFTLQTLPHFTIFTALTLLCVIVLSFFLRAAVAVVVLSPSFMAERLIEAEGLFWNSVSIARYPRQLFPRALQWAFTTIFPVAMISSFPAEILTGKELMMPLGVSMLTIAAFLIFAVLFFDFCRKRYKSVNIGM